MAPNTGRHDADESAADRARIDYLSGEFGAELDPTEQAELDDLRALLADPTLWAEPPARLEDSVVAMIAAEAASAGASAIADPAAPSPDPVAGSSAAPIDLGAARQRRERRAGARRFARPALFAAAAAVVAVALTAVLLIHGPVGERRFDVALSATELVPDARGSATMIRTNSGWQITLDATGLPRLDNGQFYQAWLKNADGVLVPIGTFNEGTDVTLWAGVSPELFSTMTITRESADGKQDSSGQRVLVGTAVPG